MLILKIIHLLLIVLYIYLLLRRYFIGNTFSITINNRYEDVIKRIIKDSKIRSSVIRGKINLLNSTIWLRPNNHIHYAPIEIWAFNRSKVNMHLIVKAEGEIVENQNQKTTMRLVFKYRNIIAIIYIILIINSIFGLTLVFDSEKQWIIEIYIFHLIFTLFTSIASINVVLDNNF